MKVSEILRVKGNTLFTTTPDEPLARAVDVMAEKDIGSLVVMDHGDAYFHGHPAPLACPEGRFRAAIGSYYYVADASPKDDEAHGAIWA